MDTQSQKKYGGTEDAMTSETPKLTIPSAPPVPEQPPEPPAPPPNPEKIFLRGIASGLETLRTPMAEFADERNVGWYHGAVKDIVNAIAKIEKAIEKV